MNMSEKQLYCKMCGVILNEENSTKIPSLHRCRDCYNKSNASRWSAAYRERKYWGGDVRSYGRNQIKKNPNEYCDDTQRQEVFDILTAIGWKFNKKNGIWYDNKIKNKDGEWLVDIEPVGTGCKTKLRKKVQDDGIPIPKVYYTVRRPEGEEHPLTRQEIRLCQELYFLQNYTTKELVDIFGVSLKEIKWVILTTRKKMDKLYND